MSEDKMREVVEFLCGTGELCGVTFGDIPDGESGKYWWRKHLRSALTALPQQVKSEDARMLEFVYSENYTSSNALVEIELRMLNGDFPTMEEVRKAIRAAISAQENKS